MTKNKPDIPSRQESRQIRVQKIVQLLGLSGAGIGITAIAGFLVNGQYVAAVISAIVTAGITFLAIGGKFVKDVWERVLDRIEARLGSRVDEIAESIVDGLENFLTKLWWQLTANFQGKYYQNLIYDCRFYKTLGLKTKVLSKELS